MDEAPTSTESSTDSENAILEETSSFSGSIQENDSWESDQERMTDEPTSDVEDSQETQSNSHIDEESSDYNWGSASSASSEHVRITRSHAIEQNLDEDSTSSAVPMTEASSEESTTHMSLPEEEQSSEVSEPPAKVRKMSSPTPSVQNDEGDGETCPICLDSWGNSGDHRLVALKCGHLFGSKCVERWIRGKNSKDRSCPTCKAKAAVKDIRYIYARRLVAVDTTELTALQKQVEAAQMEKNKMQMELQTSKIEQRSLAVQLELLQKTLRRNQTTKQQAPSRDWRFALDKNLEVWRDGGCRVLAYNCRTYEFYVSQKTTNNLFPGYGVRTVSSIDYKLGPFVHLHPKAIRDIAYSQPTDLLMSVGLDSTVRIVERGIPTTAIQCGMPLWSCTWDHLRTNQFYVGGVGGIVMQYDVRNTGTQMETFSSPGDMSPSVSLCSTEYGLLSCQLNSCWLWKTTLPGSEPQTLPLKGPFTSLCYDHESQRVLVSCRPKPTERAKLAVFKMHRSGSSDVSFDLVQSITGSARSTLMSRAAWVKCPEAAWIAAYSESESLLFLHPVEGGRTMTLPAAEATLDVCSGQVNGDTVIAALSETRLRLYKAVATNF